jgi:Zn-dependent membrane protease YugP
MLSDYLSPKVITLSSFHYKKASILSLGVSTVETNQDQDRDFLICRDQLLKTVEIVYRVETKISYFSVKIFKIETFQSRLCLETRECRDKSRPPGSLNTL